MNDFFSTKNSNNNQEENGKEIEIIDNLDY